MQLTPWAIHPVTSNVRGLLSKSWQQVVCVLLMLQDYFEFDGGSARAAEARGIKSETQEAIARWLEKNQ